MKQTTPGFLPNARPNASRLKFALFHSTAGNRAHGSGRTLPACARLGESCSRWSGAPRRSACGATLRTRRSWSSWAATRRASRAPRSRTGRGTGSLKRNLAVSGVSRADPHSPFPFPPVFCVVLLQAGHCAHGRTVGLSCCAHSFRCAPRIAPEFVQRINVACEVCVAVRRCVRSALSPPKVPSCARPDSATLLKRTSIVTLL